MDAKYGCNVERPDVQSRLVNGRVRHTWASWHVQNGTPLFALQEPGGWESAEMVRRYAHLAADHLAPYAERLSALKVVAPEGDGTKAAQA